MAAAFATTAPDYAEAINHNLSRILRDKLR